MPDKLSVEERLDIADLFSLYCHLIDSGQRESWLDLFTSDGVFEVPGMGRMEGREQIGGVADRVIEGSKGNWRHQMANVLPEAGARPGTARVKAYSLVTDWSDGGAVSTFNDYDVELKKTGDKWRIVHLLARPARITVGPDS
jgi:ketosteroid isomerase-like protein